MDLPTELLYEVIRYLPRKDLKQLRLVCSALVEPVASLLFDTVCICATHEDLEDARQILKHFGCHIRTVIFSPLTFESLNKSSYGRAVSEVCEGLKIRDCGFKKHLDLGFKTYRRLRQEALDILSTGEISTLLHSVLSNAPKVRKIALLNRTRYKALTNATLLDYCPLPSCKIPYAVHRNFQIFPRIPAVGLGDGNRTMMRSVITALSRTSSITEMITDFGDDDYHYLTTSNFDTSGRHMNQAFGFLENLTKLNLSVTTASQADLNALHDMSVAKALTKAVNLRQLCIDVGSPMADFLDTSLTTAFNAILYGCTFPKLRSFGLAFGDARQDELVSFLKTHQNIEILVLDCITLKAGFWMEVIDTVRQHLPVKIVQMNQLYGGFEAEKIEWMDCFSDIANFMFNDGPNPFSAREVARYCSDRENGRPLICITGAGHFRHHFDDRY